MCQLWSGTMKPEDVDTVGSFLQSRDCFLSGPVHRLENHVSHEQTESSWASDLCSLNSSFPINQNPDAYPRAWHRGGSVEGMKIPTKILQVEKPVGGRELSCCFLRPF